MSRLSWTRILERCITAGRVEGWVAVYRMSSECDITSVTVYRRTVGVCRETIARSFFQRLVSSSDLNEPSKFLIFQSSGLMVICHVNTQALIVVLQTVNATGDIKRSANELFSKSSIAVTVKERLSDFAVCPA